MQFPGSAKPAAGVVFDSDMGESIDDALALALLYGFDGKNECRVVATSTTNPTVKSAAYCDAVGRFYQGVVSGAIFAVGRTLPVGMGDKGKAIETPMIAQPLAKKTTEGLDVYPNAVKSMLDTAEPRTVLRNALTAQHDGNAIMILAGPATNLASGFDLPDFKDWVTRKVRYLVMVEHKLNADVPAARKLLTEWPTPIVVVNESVGTSILFPGASIEKDFAWTPNHPVADAYRAFQPMPYDAPTWSMAAALYAIRPKEGYFKVSDPGLLSMSNDGQLKLTAAADGRHRQLIFDEDQRQRIVKVYTELASAKPVPRAPRMRPQQQQQQEPSKPAADPSKPPTP